MKEIYSLEGAINRNFTGQISYIVCLDEKVDCINIDFSFDKQRVNEITDDIRKDIVEAILIDYNKEPNEEEILDASKHMKTEIHISAFLNDKFIGGIHRQMEKRNLYISKDEATLGGICNDNIEGVLKINIMVFNVIYDNTNYKLTVSSGMEGDKNV